MIMDGGRKTRTRLSTEAIVVIVMAGLVGIPACARRSSESPAITLQELVEAVSRAEGLIKDLSVKASIRVYTKSGDSLVPTPYRRTSIFKVKGIMKYQEIEGTCPWVRAPGEKPVVTQAHVKATWDGKLSRFLSDKGQGFVRDTIDPFLTTGFLETPEGFGFGTYRRATLSEVLQEVRDKVRIESDEIEGIACYKVTIPPVAGEEVPRRIWLDPSRSFNIIRQERFSEYNGDVLTVFKDYRLQQLGEGIWFPVEAIVYSFMGKTVEVYHYLVEDPLKDVIVNSNIPDDTFVIAFEAGTAVVDMTQ